jgi:hypothetical protein
VSNTILSRQIVLCRFIIENRTKISLGAWKYDLRLNKTQFENIGNSGNKMVI